jgi:hypothetical protein
LEPPKTPNTPKKAKTKRFTTENGLGLADELMWERHSCRDQGFGWPASRQETVKTEKSKGAHEEGKEGRRSRRKPKIILNFIYFALFCLSSPLRVKF